LKYTRIDSVKRHRLRQVWNVPLWWPLALLIGVLGLLIFPAIIVYRQRKKAVINER